MKKSKIPPVETVTPSPCPDWLPDTARSVWNRTIADLTTHGLYDPAFDDPLANYCLGQGAIIDAAKRGEAPQAALLAQVRQLGLALAIDPDVRRKRMDSLESEAQNEKLMKLCTQEKPKGRSGKKKS